MPEGSLRDGTGEGANGSASEILRLPGRGAHGCALGGGGGLWELISLFNTFFHMPAGRGRTESGLRPKRS